MRQAVALIKLGVPFDVAHAMTWEEGAAYLILSGQHEGGVWNWRTMEWEPPDPV